MKQFALAVLLATAILAQKSDNPFLGRWDLNVTPPTGAAYPDWIEVTQTGGALAARIQPRGGGAFVAEGVQMDGARLIVKARQGTTWELSMDSGKLVGSIKHGATDQGKIAGVRAPALDRPMPKAWTNPEPIFNGKDLSGWEPIGTNPNHWTVKNGELINEEHGANLRTTRKFQDFKLHIEYNCPDKGNSGVYLRGRYEVQVEYEPVDANDRLHSMGTIYSFVPAAVELPRKPGTWESFDITLVGRHVTIIRDGVKTIDNQEIPSLTGGALDSNEGEPGPFYLQGDHTGGMLYRNITVQLPK
ncbi:MAG: DUF1080 domain-containing protein [Bryobacteraceae bacterium]